MTLSFSNANRIQFNAPSSVLVAARAPLAPFAKRIKVNENRMDGTILGADIGKILTHLSNENFDDLLVTTLPGSSARGEPGVWDMFFNHANYNGRTGCTLVADKNYRPVSAQKSVSSLSYLDMSIPNIWVCLNQIEIGNVIGIGINDMARRTMYVMMYKVISTTLITIDKSGTVVEAPDYTGSATTSLPAVNVELKRVYRVSQDGEADVIDVGESIDDSNDDTQLEFTQHIVNILHHIPTAFPWKARFLPTSVPNISMKKIKASLLEDITRADVGDYAGFVEEAKNRYNDARLQDKEKRRKLKNTNRDTGSNNRVKSTFPVIRALLRDDTVFVTFVDENYDASNGKSFCFPVEDLGVYETTEVHLTNKDVRPEFIDNYSGIFKLDEDTFGKDAYVRWLYVRF